MSSISITNLLPGVFSVLDYLTGGGANTDLYPGLVAANAAAAARGGGVVYVPPGSYRLAATFAPAAGVVVWLARGVSLAGAGAITPGDGWVLDQRAGLVVGARRLAASSGVPDGASAYAPRPLEIAAGQTLAVGAGAVLEIG